MLKLKDIKKKIIDNMKVIGEKYPEEANYFVMNYVGFWQGFCMINEMSKDDLEKVLKIVKNELKNKRKA